MQQSDTRNVEVKFVCDRTGKTDTIEMSLEKVEAFYKTQEAKIKATAAIKKELTALPAENMPDLVVYYRGKVVVLSNVNIKYDNMISRHLHEITNNDAVFPAVEVTNKRTRKNVVKEDPIP